MQGDKKGKAKVREVESVEVIEDDEEEEEYEGEEVTELLDEDGGFHRNDEFIDINIIDD